MKRYLLAGVALALAMSALSAHAQTSTMTPATTVAPNNQTAIIQPVTPDATNPTGFVDRRSTIAQILGAGGRVVNMIDYGADPTSATNSCGTPLTNALAALNAIPTGGVLYFPRGYYQCANQITWTNKPIAIVGDGPGITFLIFTSAAANQAGIKINQNTPLYPIIIRDLQIQTNIDQPTNNAITIAYAVPPAITSQVTIENVLINGNGANQFYWKNGIFCSGCSFSYFANVTIVGKQETLGGTGISAANMNAAVHLNGLGMTGGVVEASTDVKLIGVVASLAKYGFYISGDSEGAHIVGSTAFGVNYGVYQDDGVGSGDPTSAPNMPGAFINGMDCASWNACVTMKGWGSTMIRGVQGTKRPESTQNWHMIELLDGTFGAAVAPSSGTIMSGNQSNGESGLTAGGTGTHAIFGPGATGNIITGDWAGWDDYFVDVGSGTGVNYVHGNTQHSSPGVGITQAWVTGTNPNIIFKMNLPMTTPNDVGYVVLPSGTATPSVGSKITDQFILANPSAQNITNFANGYVGQTITVVFNTPNQVIVSGSGIFLATGGGANWTPTNGSTLTLRKETATYWREIGRTQF